MFIQTLYAVPEAKITVELEIYYNKAQVTHKGMTPLIYSMTLGGIKHVVFLLLWRLTQMLNMCRKQAVNLFMGVTNRVKCPWLVKLWSCSSKHGNNSFLAIPAYTGIAFGLIYKITQLHKQTDYFWSSKNVGLLRTKVKTHHHHNSCPQSYHHGLSIFYLHLTCTRL